MTYQGKSLTGGSPGDKVDAPFTQLGSLANRSPREAYYRRGDGRRLREIKLVNRGVNRIDFDCCGYIEASLLQA
jgi:hypothetical protein